MTVKKTTLKKPVIRMQVGMMTPEERVTFARSTQNTAKASPVFTGSPPAQMSMTAWQQTSDALDANNQAIAKEEMVLATLRGQEPSLLYAYDLAASDYAANVRLLAKSDPTVVTALGLTPAALPGHSPAIVAPVELHIKTTKAGVDSFVWTAVPGARLYVAQYSVDPATATSWVTIEGGGKSRKLTPLGLTHGQAYLLRVKALGASEEGPWSATLGYVGK